MIATTLPLLLLLLFFYYYYYSLNSSSIQISTKSYLCSVINVCVAWTGGEGCAGDPKKAPTKIYIYNQLSFLLWRIQNKYKSSTTMTTQQTGCCGQAPHHFIISLLESLLLQFWYFFYTIILNQMRDLHRGYVCCCSAAFFPLFNPFSRKKKLQECSYVALVVCHWDNSRQFVSIAACLPRDN